MIPDADGRLRDHAEAAAWLADNKAGPWWLKCREPERPGDEWSAYIWRCDACMYGLATDARLTPDVLSIVHDGPPRSTDLASTLAEANEWRAREGLSPIG